MITAARNLLNNYPAQMTGDSEGAAAIEDAIEAIETLIADNPQYTSDDLKPLLETLQAKITAYQANVTAVTGIQAEDMSLKVGEQKPIAYQITPKDATNPAVEFTNHNPEVISLADDGTISALRKGSAKVTITTVDGGYSTDVTITVRSDTLPSINASDITIEVGSDFNPLDYASAADEEDGTIALSADNVIENTVDTSKEGEGIVTYSVTDNDGNTVTKTIHVTVKENAEVRAARDSLKGAIAAARRLNASQYTKESYAKLTAALEQAEAIAADPLASKQELSDASEALETAVAGLQMISGSHPSQPGGQNKPSSPSENMPSETDKEQEQTSADTGIAQQQGMAASFFAMIASAGVVGWLMKRKKQHRS